ncbi:MAG: AAA family ATPase [Acidimicrobiales bacterium]|nr:AAA family ATPase [Acidimicrobiales bacterium]MYD84395.1 AAA family ATPase [Acidimicrobiales bacterium]MYJ64939.1 AAA family ATPase [Acidimicrobiales bacterium]
MINHPYQLRRIELQDFKSVAQASVDLHPLTVVVGANSSGKSTLLQAILAVTQAVRAGTNTADFPLNGEFVRLGTFDETRNFLTTRPDEPMQVAIELVDAGAPLGSFMTETGEDEPPLTQLLWRAYVTDAQAADGEDRATSGFAYLSALQIEIGSFWPDSGDEVTRLLSCDVSEFTSASDSLTGLRFIGRRGRLPSPSGRAIGATGRVQDWESGASSAIDAVVLGGGVPRSLLRRVGLFDRLAEVWWNTAQDLLSEELQEQKAEVADKGPPKRPSQAAIAQARTDLESLDLSDAHPASSELPITRGFEAWGDALDRVLYRRIGQLSDDQRRTVGRSMVHLGEATFRQLLRDELSEEDWVDDEVLVEQSGPAGEALARCGFISQRFFRSAVRYLGPLREAPHVLYDPGPSKLDLGVRGEYSAAVLHAQANRTVLMPTPAGHGERRQLEAALNYWLREFDLAENARSEDRGRIGIGLSVTPKGLRREVDLTSVGVGVSQVLPVILLCLLAEPGTLIVLEQPELHLHPRLQQDLADFLLACSRSGRQIVLETHSEHLVNRLRYRIAQDESDEAHALVGLVFAENDDGITRYREPEINVYGGLGEDWPAGFLDLTAREAQELVRESLAKRQRDKPLDDLEPAPVHP